jgi:hypothetical protein
VAFTVPSFNVLCRTLRFSVPLGAWLPNLVNQPCQLYVNPRIGWAELAATGQPAQFVRVPKGTDIVPGDRIEIIPGSNWWYETFNTERVHLGFPNEYFVAYVTQIAFGGGSSGRLLMEDGSFLLLEDSSKILLE